MLSKSLLVFCIIITISSARFPNIYPKLSQKPVKGDPGQPLILTPLIEAGKIKEAQLAAKINFNGFKGVKSYAGYFTVNKPYNSNLYFWFFPSESDYKNDPIVLWLQGGPGATSLFGLFMENGPFQVKKEGLTIRDYSWTKTHSVIYIDNPVGTGYSFTDNGYCQNETQVASDLYNALQQFFLLFPELQKNDFYVTGESYAGKYVPAISYYIHQKNPSAKLKINLKGLSMGNGFSDPEHQLNYGDYLYQIGLIDSNVKKLFEKYENAGINYIKNKEYVKAFLLFDSLLDGDLNNGSSLFKNITGFTNYYNYLSPNASVIDDLYLGAYLQRTDVRAAMHVGNATFNVENPLVEVNLMPDVMQSVAPWISELLNHYRVLVYNGQLDIIVAYPLTVNYLQNLKFSGADVYKTAPRYQWYVDGDLAGYVKHAGNLTEVLVRNAGHMVPGDQPKWAFDLISRFTRNKRLFQHH